jgi:hypothetical protein
MEEEKARGRKMLAESQAIERIRAGPRSLVRYVT